MGRSKGWARKWFRALCLVGGLGAIAVLTAMVAIAGGSSGRVRTIRNPIDRAALKRDHDAQQARAASLRARRAEPAERASRERSRHAYTDASNGEALRVARRAHGEVLDAPVWEPLPLRGDEHIKRHLGASAAVVTDGNGNSAVFESALPMLSETDAGALEPTSLDLVRKGTEIVPANPIVPTTIGGQLGDGTHFDGTGVTFRVDGDQEAEASVTDGKAFFANTRPDTDVVEVPQPNGVETLFDLRSADSPEEHRLHFTLPEGAALRQGPDGGVQITRGDATLATIAPPAAWDADGVEVPTSYEVSGDDLVVQVSHRAGDYAYPIMVDPQVYWDYRNWNTNSGLSDTGWRFLTPTPSKFGSLQLYNTWYGRGDYILTPRSTVHYTGGEWGAWDLWAPAGAYIFRVDFNNGHYDPSGSICLQEGLLGADGGPVRDSSFGYWDTHDGQWHAVGTEASVCATVWNQWTWSFYFSTDNGAHVNFDPQAAVNGNIASWGLSAFAATDAYESIGFEGGALVGLGDRIKPTAALTGITPNTWIDGTATAQVTGQDSGLGVKSLSVSSAGTPTQSANATCNYSGPSAGPPLGSSPCPATVGPIAFPTSAMPEGVRTITASTTDAVSNSGANSWTVKIDRSAPTLNDTGTLKSASDGYPGPNANLHVAASDSYSGVQSIEVQVDGTRKDYYAPNAACDGCSLSRDWTWHDADYAPGDHEVKVIATDFAGHTAIDRWTVTTDDAEPDVSVTGSLWDADQSTISETSYSLSIDAGDGSADDPETGVKSLEIQVDGVQTSLDTQTCAAGNCGMTKSWQFYPSQYADGAHTIDIITTDQAGNIDTEEVGVMVKNIPASSPQTLNASSSTELITGDLPGDHAGQATADIGDVNADGYDDYAIGAPGASPSLPPAAGVPPVLRPTAGKVYVVYGKGTPPAQLDLGTLTPTDGYTISGALTRERCGTAVTPAGDVNGDGLDDMLIGCPATDGSMTAPSARGHVYVLFGTTAPANVDLANLGTGGFVITGPLIPAGAFGVGTRPFGAYLSGPRSGLYGAAADVNGDDRDDIVIGSSTESNNSRTLSGSTYVIYGKTDTAPVDTGSLGTSGFRIDGAAAGNASGFAAANVGDVSGDDYADVVITAPSANPAGRTMAGTAYVVYGKAEGANVDLSALGSGGFPIYGATGNQLGSSIATYGDLDDDGVNDILLGGHGAFLVYGRENSAAEDLAAPGLAYTMQAPTGAEYDGAIVNGGGDLTDDGLPDILVSFPQAQTSTGAMFVVPSHEGLTPFTGTGSISTTLPGQFASQIVGQLTGDGLGASADGIESYGTNMSGDSTPAIAIGAPNRANSRGAGAGGMYVMPASALASNAPPAGAASASSHPRHCWSHKDAYPFHDPFTDFPTVCRKTQRGNREQTPRGAKKGFGGHVSNSGRPYGGNVRQPFSKGKRLAGRVPIYDSDRAQLGYLDQLQKHKHFKLYDTGGTEIPTTQKGSHLRLLLEGTPCMTTDHDPGNNALFSVQGGGSELAGLRFVLDRGDLPAHAFSPSRTNDDVIDSGWVACHKPPSSKHLNADPLTYDFPGFVNGGTNYANDDAYEGYNAAATCQSHPKQKGNRFSPNCATNYWDYQSPRTALAGFPNTAVVSASSTGIGGGGIARAVLKVGGGVATSRMDYIGYVDPNVPCLHRPVAHWRLLRRMGIWGWLPTREQQPQGTVRNGSECH
jgi:hypothetical protein